MNSLTRNLICLLAIALSATSVTAADNPFGAVWPFGKSKESNPVFTSPFAKSKKPTGSSLMDSPSRLLKKADKTTDAFVKKTKDGWHGVQDFGRSMNPFSKQQAKKTKKKSFLDTVFPKHPVEKGPSTMGEFLTMKRPGF